MCMLLILAGPLVRVFVLLLGSGDLCAIPCTISICMYWNSCEPLDTLQWRWGWLRWRYHWPHWTVSPRKQTILFLHGTSQFLIANDIKKLAQKATFLNLNNLILPIPFQKVSPTQTWSLTILPPITSAKWTKMKFGSGQKSHIIIVKQSMSGLWVV